uniref:Uncharacterized protein n=1 Tax=Acrobeloides nanus TaxID=290746 RepID=A0A914DXS2_9BILA
MPSSARKNHSPAWKNPREVFKKNLYKRKSSRQVFENLPSKIDQDVSIGENLPAVSTPKKSKIEGLNPFKKPSPTKRSYSAQKSSRLKLINWNAEIDASNKSMECDIDWDDSIAQQPFDTSFQSLSETNTSFIEQNLSSLYPIDFSHLSGCISSSTPKSSSRPNSLAVVERQTSSHMPKDLRLGTKLRVISKKPFPWIKNVNTPGQSLVMITALERDIAIKHVSSKELDSEADLPRSSTPLTKLQMALCYFQFPNISFMQMFPRIDGQPKSSLSSHLKALNLKSIDPSDSTFKEWTQSFDQLYHSWKRSDRRSFYICSSKFTVLFFKSALPLMETGATNVDETCWSVNGSPRLQVVITPTSKGLRQLLRDEGIEFELPLSQTSRRNSREHSGSKPSSSNNEHSLTLLEHSSTCTFDVTQSQPPFIGDESPIRGVKPVDNEDESPTKNDLSGDEEETWLKDMGVSPAAIRLKRHHTVAELSSGASFNDSGLTSADDKQQTRSTALITDSASIQGLYNLLYNGKIGRVMIGPQAGLPPTLIATTPFMNSALRELSKSSQVVKKNGKETQFILELESGPILPTMPKMVMEFIKSVPSLNSADNKVTMQINGRHVYTGFNETIDSASFTNNNEFDFSNDLYSF